MNATVDALLARLAEAGCRVEVAAGKLVLRGRVSAVPPDVLAQLRWHKEEIVRRLSPAPLRVWVWRDGHTYAEEPGDGYHGTSDRHPTGAWWLRHAGERRLRPVPGRPGEHWITTERLP